MTRAARAPEIACDSRKQKLYHLNQPLEKAENSALAKKPRVTSTSRLELICPGHRYSHRLRLR